MSAFEAYIRDKKIIQSGVFISSDFENNKISIRAANGFEFFIALVFYKEKEGNVGDIKKDISGNTVTYRSCIGDDTTGIGIRTPDFIATISGKKWFFAFWCSFESNKRDILVLHYSVYEESSRDEEKSEE